MGGIRDPQVSLISFAHLQSAVHAAVDTNSDTPLSVKTALMLRSILEY